MVWSFFPFICIHFNIEKSVINSKFEFIMFDLQSQKNTERMKKKCLTIYYYQIGVSKSNSRKKKMSRRLKKGDWIEWFSSFDFITKLFICSYEWMGWFQNTHTTKKNHSNVLLTIQMKLIVKWYSDIWRIGIYRRLCMIRIREGEK